MNKQKQSDQIAVGDVVKRMISLQENIFGKARAFTGKWKEWFDGTRHDPACKYHPESIVEPDVEQSVLLSSRGGDMRVVWSKCPQCEAERSGERMVRWLVKAGVPENLKHCSLGNWTPTTIQNSKALESVNAWVKSGFKRALILMSPECGVGKTHLAVACLKAFGRGRFVEHETLVRKVRGTYSTRLSSEEILDAYAGTGFLVIDDLGVVDQGADVLPMLHHILQERYERELPFVLTANMRSLIELERYIGGRMADRIFREFLWDACVLNGESQRGKKSKEK